MNKKVILYIAMSLDGFIARKNGAVDWLDAFNTPPEDYGYKDFLKSIDTVIMGNTTYEQVLTFGDFPYKNKNCYVFAHKSKKDDNVTFVSKKCKTFIEGLSTSEHTKIWLVGGANLVNQFMQSGLIDEFIISIIPTVLGEGIPLFSKNNKEVPLTVMNTKSYDSGIVQIKYKCS